MMAIVLRNGGSNDLTERLHRIGVARLAQGHALPVFDAIRDALTFLRRCRDLSEMAR